MSKYNTETIIACLLMQMVYKPIEVYIVGYSLSGLESTISSTVFIQTKFLLKTSKDYLELLAFLTENMI